MSITHLSHIKKTRKTAQNQRQELHRDGGLSIANIPNHNADFAMNSYRRHRLIKRRHMPVQLPISSIIETAHFIQFALAFRGPDA